MKNLFFLRDENIFQKFSRESQIIDSNGVKESKFSFFIEILFEQLWEVWKWCLEKSTENADKDGRKKNV